MITPLQSASFAASTSMMQSILETIEDRQREEADKANGRKNDETRAPALHQDATALRANARINEHFFGNRDRGEETIATMIVRLSDALGISQRPEETSRAFAQRLSDMVALAKNVRVSGKETPQVTLQALGTTLDAVINAMGGGQTNDAAAGLVARLARSEGIIQAEGEADADFGQRLTDMLTHLRGAMPEDEKAIEKQTGLFDLGLKVDDLIEALRDPYGSTAKRVKEALADKARAEGALTPEMRKTLARLEDTADPKTIEELKAERTRRDPTRVEDAETRTEREDTIRALEAGEKLEDVAALQKAVHAAHEKKNTGPASDADAETDPVTDALETVQLLAAGMVASKPVADHTSAPDRETEEPPPESPEEAMRGIEVAVQRADEERRKAEDEIFALRIDGNGIYDLITRQLAA